MTSAINAAGYTLNGNSTASGNLTLDSTSNATKGYVLINPTGGNVGIGTTNPKKKLSVAGKFYAHKTADLTARNYLTSYAWTARTSAADNGWYGITWSPELGLFAAVALSGVGNRVMTSPDGITWTARTSAADNSWRSIALVARAGALRRRGVHWHGNRVMTSVSSSYRPCWPCRLRPA